MAKFAVVGTRFSVQSPNPHSWQLSTPTWSPDTSLALRPACYIYNVCPHHHINMKIFRFAIIEKKGFLDPAWWHLLITKGTKERAQWLLAFVVLCQSTFPNYVPTTLDSGAFYVRLLDFLLIQHFRILLNYSFAYHVIIIRCVTWNKRHILILSLLRYCEIVTQMITFNNLHKHLVICRARIKLWNVNKLETDRGT